MWLPSTKLRSVSISFYKNTTVILLLLNIKYWLIILYFSIHLLIYRHPSSFYKDILAQSLVSTYPVLASSTPDIPQALWFHANARGKHRHSGRLHYHMEYIARKSDERKIRRMKMSTQPNIITDPLALPHTPVDNIEQMVRYLTENYSTRF